MSENSNRNQDNASGSPVEEVKIEPVPMPVPSNARDEALDSAPAPPPTASSETAATGTHSNPTNATNLSKNQRKRLLNREKILEHKRQRKEERRAQAIASGRDLDAERRFQQERTALGHRKQRLEELWRTVKRPLAEDSFGIGIDASFESLQTPREIASLAQQIRYCYSYNKKSPNPCFVAVTSVQEKSNNSLATLLQKEAGYSEWSHRLFTCTPQSLEDYYGYHSAQERSKLVYLTSDSETTLERLDNDKIYIIGGIVDRNRCKRVAWDRAQSLGISTAKLPLKEHLLSSQMASTPVLTCNHVFDILLKYREYNNDWSRAFQDVLPRRKDAKFVATTTEKKKKKKTQTTIQDEMTNDMGPTSGSCST